MRTFTKTIVIAVLAVCTVGSVYNADIAFAPMAWNGAYNVSRIRAWLTAHPESPYLLGFNEPNFADQARMTPAQAVAAWPGLEALADEFDIPLVAPALNFSNSQVGGAFRVRVTLQK